MENPRFKFEELTVYQKALDFVDDIYAVTKEFPKEELYALSSQYKRASVSITLNIAEGAGDTDTQFIDIYKWSGIVLKNVLCVQQLRKGKDS